MKRFLCVFPLLLLFLSFPVYAEEQNMALTGPEALHPEDSFSLCLETGLEPVTRVEFVLTYGQENLLFYGADFSAGGAWSVTALRSRLIFTCEEPQQKIPALRFSVSGAKVGQWIRIQLSEITVTADGETHFLDAACWECQITQPPSDDSALSFLAVTNSVLTPAFSPAVQEYTAALPPDTQTAEITALPRDERAKVEISGLPTALGDSAQVTVTVTAENGDRRVYTVMLVREIPTEPSTEIPTQIQTEITQPPMSEPTTPGTESSAAPAETKPRPTQAEETEAKPTATEPVSTKPTQAEETEAKPSATEPVSTKPTQTKPTEAKPTQIKPTEPKPAATAAPIQPTASSVETGEPDTTEPTQAAQSTAPTEEPSLAYAEIPNWVYIVTAVAAVTAAAAAGILITERKK